eukprot:CAMPEP_0171221838 /NCGR_PEP_ID=MMETSP0790-20130122/34960_1 /TAXON_ID=2925 /ORGANISM="Alexandrium catenella, Strain OF101" /LENGTH=75 /DNA_ID=CAMNT_0011687777 /DNA_START=45 /DNA_END=268 /DNA_ORIENTATION=+
MAGESGGGAEVSARWRRRDREALAVAPVGQEAAAAQSARRGDPATSSTAGSRETVGGCRSLAPPDSAELPGALVS